VERIPQRHLVPTYGFGYAYINHNLYERQNVENIEIVVVDDGIVGRQSVAPTTDNVIFVQFGKINFTLF
jgi:hypothetical protein